ncbi:MAG: CYTH domain-containing protein [Candidatus Micrarchaeota archaeon]
MATRIPAVKTPNSLFSAPQSKEYYGDKAEGLELRWWQKFGWAMNINLPGFARGPATAWRRADEKALFFKNVADYLESHREDFVSSKYGFLEDRGFLAYLRRNKMLLRKTNILRSIDKSAPYLSAPLDLLLPFGKGAQSLLFKMSLKAFPHLFGKGFRSTSPLEAVNVDEGTYAERRIGAFLFRILQNNKLGIPLRGSTGNSVKQMGRELNSTFLIDHARYAAKYYLMQSLQIQEGLQQLSYSARLSTLNQSKTKYVLNTREEYDQLKQELGRLVKARELKLLSEEPQHDVYYDTKDRRLGKQGRSLRLRTITANDKTQHIVIFDKSIRGGFHEEGFVITPNSDWNRVFSHLGIRPVNKPKDRASVDGLLARYGFKPIMKLEKTRTSYVTKNGVKLNFDDNIRYSRAGAQRTLLGWLEANLSGTKREGAEEIPLPFEHSRFERKRSLELLRERA